MNNMVSKVGSKVGEATDNNTRGGGAVAGGDKKQREKTQENQHKIEIHRRQQDENQKNTNPVVMDSWYKIKLIIVYERN